jgi:ribosomal protein S1
MTTPDTPVHTPDPNALEGRVGAHDDAAAAPASQDAAYGSVNSDRAPAATAPRIEAEAAQATDITDPPGPSAAVHGNGHGAGIDGEPTAAEPSPDPAAGTPAEVDGEPTAAEPSPDPAAGAASQHEKKRRKRRRKKKPGAHAAVDIVPGEGSESEDAEASARETGTSPTGDGPDPRAKARERRPAPRERPPVNAGDIVFAKIIEITDEAIFVDIPGKAHAIFDRREMLLPDDEEPSGARSSPRAADPIEPPTGATPGGRREATAEAPTGEVGATPVAETDAIVESSDDAATASPGEAEQTIVAPAAVAPAAVAPAAVAPAAVAPAAVAPAAVAPAAVAPAAVAPAAVAPAEPKVPHVILEVGADFIGVVHNDGSRGGLVVLTHHPHRAEKAKPAIEKAFNEKATILGLVTGVIKGGAEVDIDGVRSFAPGSHVDLRLGADLSYLVGKRLSFYVTQYAKRGRDVVLSRRSLLEEEAKKARSEALAKLTIGQDLDGVVRSVVPFGAFIDVGGVEGLVPLQEMSHNRGDGPSDVFKAGEATRVRVTKIDDRGKIWLSRRAVIPDPWQQVAQKYAVGTRHAGKVARLQPFGAFIELESGVDGLIHTVDLSIKRIESPADVVKVGDPIEVVVSHIDPLQHKIALHPAPQGAAAAEAPQRVAMQKPVKAKVVNIETGGLVVRILGVTGRNARGYVTASGTGTPRGTELRKAFNIGQEIEGKVIEMDPRRGEVKLSIKALSEDQERNAYQNYRQQLKAEARFTFGDLLAKKGNPR